MEEGNCFGEKAGNFRGEIVRIALDEKWHREEELQSRKAVIDRILKHRKVIKGKIDYKALIDEGKKY